MTGPIVTVLIDTYNHERFIEEAIISVLDQDFPRSETEILVVDDGSTDRTPEIVRKFEPHVRLLRKKNGGQASAFNAGIPETRGEIVAFLDGDDWWAKNKLTRVAEAMRADPAVGIVGHGIIVVHRGGNTSEVLREGFQFRANTLEGALLFRLRKSLLGTSRMTIRTDLLRRIGRVPETLVFEADEYLFTLAAVLMQVRILPDALTFYRIHDSNKFQISDTDPTRARRKMEVLSALVSALSEVLSRGAVEPKAQKTLLEVLRAESRQIGLMLDGGSPWEMAKTEWTLYRALSPHASLPHRLFKISVLSAGLLLSPKTFYRWRALAAQNRCYAWLRQAVFSHDHPRHVEHTTGTGAIRQCGS